MRFHLFPFRTEKLSSLTPMVLRLSRGRVGSRLFKVRSKGLTFFFVCTCWNLRGGCRWGVRARWESVCKPIEARFTGRLILRIFSAICAWCRDRSVRTERAAAWGRRRPAVRIRICVRSAGCSPNRDVCPNLPSRTI